MILGGSRDIVMHGIRGGRLGATPSYDPQDKRLTAHLGLKSRSDVLLAATKAESRREDLIGPSRQNVPPLQWPERRSGLPR